jgi:hypothetical protein
LAVVHTEEEFDWNSPFSSTATLTTHARHLDRGHAIFVRHGAKPVYAIDYPIATDPAAVEVLQGFLAAETAIIGAHLHPWVSPPIEEAINVRNSYPGNLPAALERAKIECLSEMIDRRLGRTPRIYLAGRYGFGSNTAAILEACGYEVDLSPSPTLDFRKDGGPDYLRTRLTPRWLGRLLQIPHTGAFVGPLAKLAMAPTLWARPGWGGQMLRSAAARSRLLYRLQLTPEGFDLEAMRTLTTALVRRGIRLFVLSFHSPSLVPGFTPYVRNEADLVRFLATLDGYLDWFRTVLGGSFSDPLTERDRQLRALP